MISLRTNMTSLIVQKNLAHATAGLNRAIEQMTTGYKLNHAKDNPANYAIMKQLERKLCSWEVAQDNMMMGIDMLDTASDNADLISNHVSRIRDLCMQGVNGTYGEQSLNAIKLEVKARAEEINRIVDSTEYNGIKLFGEKDSDGNVIPKILNLQIGIDGSESSRISVKTSFDIEGLNKLSEIDITSPDSLKELDKIINSISGYQVEIGSSQNRLEYALDYAETTTENITSSLSTIRDADIAKVSSDFIRYQILQQACATLLATANQMPSIALQLL